MADWDETVYETEVIVFFTAPPLEEAVMPDIFKADIAGKINAAMGPLLFDLQLIVVTPGVRGADLTAGVSPTTVTYPCKGFVDDYRDTQIDGTIIQRGDRSVLILGASLPAGIAPKPNDKIIAEERTGVVINVIRDPAGATYACQWR